MTNPYRFPEIDMAYLRESIWIRHFGGSMNEECCTYTSSLSRRDKECPARAIRATHNFDGRSRRFASPLLNAPHALKRSVGHQLRSKSLFLTNLQLLK